MAEPKDDGGPAFASTPFSQDLTGWSSEGTDESLAKNPPGMSLRQWYAGRAMSGMMSEPERPRHITYRDYAEEAWIELARHAFDIADAMLAHERKEREAPK